LVIRAGCSMARIFFLFSKAIVLDLVRSAQWIGGFDSLVQNPTHPTRIHEQHPQNPIHYRLNWKRRGLQDKFLCKIPGAKVNSEPRRRWRRVTSSKGCKACPCVKFRSYFRNSGDGRPILQIFLGESLSWTEFARRRWCTQVSPMWLLMQQRWKSMEFAVPWILYEDLGRTQHCTGAYPG